MNDDNSGIWALLVVAGLALVGVVLWRKGVFSNVSQWLGAPPAGYNPAIGMPVGPTEPGAAAPQGGSAYGRVCNAAYSTVGKSLSQAPDPRAAAAGVVTQAAGPLVCAAQEYVGGKVIKGTVSTVKTAGGAVKDGAKAAWNNTIGKIF